MRALTHIPRARMPSRPHALALAALVCGVLATAPARAATLTWGTSGTGGDGTWTATNGWWNGTGQQSWVSSPADSAIFAGTPGTVTLGGNVTSGSVLFTVDGYTIAAGNTLTLNTGFTANGSATIGSAVALGAANSWSVAAGKTLTLNGVVSGAQTLSYGGSGTYAINANNTSSGNLTIDTATVNVATSGATLFASGFGFGGSRSVTIQNGATLSAPNWDVVAGQASDAAGTVVFATGGGTFIMNASGNMGSTVNKGFTVNSNVTGTFAVQSGVTGTWSGNFSGRDFIVNSGGTLAFAIDGAFTTSRFISGAGSVQKTGTGTLTLSQANTYTGTTTVGAGRVVVGNANALGATTAALAVNGGTVDLNATSVTVGLFTGASSGTVTNGAASSVTLTTNSASSGTFAGTITQGSGTLALAKSGAGTLALSGSNSYSGGTTLNAGQLNINNANAIGTGAFTIAGGTIDNTSGAAITMATNNTQSWNADFTFAGTSPLTFGTGAVTLSANRQVTVTSSTLTVGGVVGGAFSLTKAGAGTLSLSGATTFSGGGAVTGGTLLVPGSNNGSGAWTIGNGTLDLRGGNGLYFGRGFFGVQNQTYVTVNTGGTLISDKFAYNASNNLNELRNNYGQILVNGGTLQLTGSQSFLRAFTIGANGATLDTPTGATITKLAGSAAGENAIRFSANSTLTFSGGGSFTMNDPLGSYGSTGFSIVKDGTGTVTLNGASSATGTTTINAGRLVVGAATALGATSAGLAANGGTLDLNGNSVSVGLLTGSSGAVITNAGAGAVTLTLNSASSGTFAGAITQSGGVVSLTKAGAGTLTLAGTSTFTGGGTISGGTFALLGSNTSAGTTWGSWTINGGVMDLRGGNGLFGTSGFWGNNSVTKVTITSGTLISDKFEYGANNNFNQVGNNYYNISINGGTLQLTGTQSMFRAFQVTGNGGTVNVPAGADVTKSAGTTGGQNVIYFTANSSLTLQVAGTYTINDALGTYGSTGFSIVKSDTGTVVLAGANAYTGTTSVNAGTLRAGSTTAFGAANSSTTSVVVAAGATLDVNGQGTTRGVTISGSGVGGLGALVNTGAATGSNLIQTPNIALAADATIGGSGNFYMINTSYTANALTLNNFTLTKVGANTFFLANTTVSSGTVRVSGGTLSQFNTASTGSAAAFILDDTAGASLALNSLALSVGSLSGGGGTGGTVSLGSGTLTVGALGTSTTYSGSIGGSGGVTKTGAGTLTLAGTSGFTGVMTVSSGTVSVATVNDASAAGPLGSSANAVVLGSSGASGGLRYTGATAASSKAFTLATGGTGVFDVSSASATLSLTGGIGGSGLFTKAGGGTLLLSGSNTFSGTASLAAGVLALGTSSALAGGGNITFAGGTLQYTGSNTVDYAARIKGSSAAVAIDTNGQTVTFGGAVDSTNVAGLTKLGSGTLALTGSNTFSGAATVTGGVLQIGDGGSVAGAITNNATLAVNRTDAFTLSNQISGSGGLLQAGSGTTTLAGANSYSGATTVSGGVLSVSSEANLGAVPGSATPGNIVLNGGALSFTSGFTLTATRGIAVGPTTGSGTGTIDVAGGQTLAYGGVIADNGIGTDGLVKSGGGILSLTGAATYSGNTSVNAGTLELGAGGSLASPLVTVASGATLSGRGTVNAVTVSSGGILAPGLSNSGTLTLSSLSFTGTGTINVGVGLSNTPSSLLSVLGNVTTGGGANSVTFAFTNLAAINTGTYALLSYTGTQLADVAAFTYSGATGGRQSVELQNGTLAVNLVIGNAFPIWSGTTGSDWTSANDWVLSSTGSSTSFQAQDTVVFDDSGSTGTVTLSSTVNPATTTFSGTTLAYSLSSSNGSGITTGALVKSGPATLTISTSNSFSGGTTLSAGTIRIGNDAALGTGAVAFTGTATISSDGGSARTLANGLNANADMTLGDAVDNGNLTFSGTVSLGGGPRTITTPSNVTFSGLVTNGGLTKAGSGALTLSGSNTFGGGTTLSAGTLRIGNDAALGSAGVTLDAGTLSSSDTNGRTLTNAFTLGGNVTLGDATNTGALSLGSVGGVNLGGASRQVTTPSNVTFAGAVTNGGLTKLGAGTLTLSASNSYTAGTTLSAGDISLGNVGALGTGTATYAGAGTIRTTVGGTVANAIAVNAGVSGTIDSAANTTTLSGGIANAGTLTLTTSATQALSGAISGTGTIVKAGPGGLTLSGANTLSGAVSLTAGRLNLNSASALGTGSLVIAGTSTLDNTSGAAVELTGANPQSWNADFTFAGSNPLNLGSGAVTLGGNRQVTVTSSTLTVGGGLGGGFALTKAGAGTLALTGSGGYSGGTTLSAGTLLVGNASALGTGAVALNGGTLNVNGFTIANNVVLGGGSLAPNGGTLSGIVSDGAVQSLSVGSSVTLTGVNTYSGSTTITGGTLTVGGAGQLGAGTYSAAIANAGTLAIATSANQVLAGGISGTGGLAKSGAGVLTLSASNAFTGGVTLSSGQLNVNNSRAIGTGTLTLAGGTLDTTTGSALTITSANPQSWSGNFTFAGSNPLNLGTGAVTLTGNRQVTVTSSTLSVGGVVGGAFSLTKAGAGTLTLSGATTFSGGGAVSGGTLLLPGSNSGAGEWTIANGTLDLRGGNGLYFGLGFFGVQNQTYITVNTGGTIISDKFDYGASNNLNELRNNYGQIVINGGTLRLTGTQSFARAFTIGANGATIDSPTGASISKIAGSAAGQIAIRFSANSTLTFTGGGNFTMNDPLGDYGSTGFSILKTGTGTLSLTGASTFTGGVRLDAGRLNITQAAAIGTGTLTLAGGTLDNTGGSAITLANNAQSWAGDFAFAGTNPLNLGTGAVTLTGDRQVTVTSSTLTVGGVVGGGAASLTKAGGGVLALSAANTFAGGVTLAAGTIDVGDAAALGSGTVTLTGASTLRSGLAGTIANPFTVQSAVSGTLDVTNATTLSGAIGGGGSLVKTGAGTLTLSGSNAFAGGVSLAAGTLVAGHANGLGTGNLTFAALATFRSTVSDPIANNIVLAASGTFDAQTNSVLAGTVTGAGGLTKTGAGALTLSASNSFAGGSTISAGVLEFASGGLGSGTATVGAATLRWAAGNTQDVSASGLALVDATTATLDIGSNNVTLGSGFGAGSTAGVTKVGAGTLTLSGSSGYTGPTTVSIGTLALTGSGAIATASGVALQAAESVLDISSASGNRTIGVLTGTAGSQILLGGNTLAADGIGLAGPFGGVISGAGGFTKAGEGSLVLSDVQAFTGPARVDAGVLALGGTSTLASASSIFVAAGATLEANPAGLAIVGGQTLGGYGEVTEGAIEFLANSILSPGGSVGELEGIAGATLNGGMTYIFEINNAGGTAGVDPGWDLFSSSGVITLAASESNQILLDINTLNGSVSGSAANFDPNANYAWKFLVAGTGNEITYQPGWFNLNTSDFENDTNGSFYVARGDQLTEGFGSGTSNELYIVYAAIPEPGSLVLAGIGLVAAVGMMRRKGRRVD